MPSLWLANPAPVVHGRLGLFVRIVAPAVVVPAPLPNPPGDDRMGCEHWRDRDPATFRQWTRVEIATFMPEPTQILEFCKDL